MKKNLQMHVGQRGIEISIFRERKVLLRGNYLL